MIYLLKNVEIKDHFKTCDGTSYPANWLELSSVQDKNKIGIITLEEIYPELQDSRYSYDGTYVDNLVEKTRTYNVIFTEIIEEPIPE